MPGHYTDTTIMQDGVDQAILARGTGGVGEEIDKIDDRLYAQNTGGADIDATRMTAATAKVISSGSITATQGVHTVTSESGSADDLTNILITGGNARWFILLKATSGHTITVKHAAGGSGQIKLSTSADYVLSGDKSLLLWHDGTTAVDLSVPSAGGTDEKAKVSANDTTPGYLNGKLVAGTGISFTENNDGGNETLTITNSGAAGSALPVNAIPNSSFEVWERGTAAPPDGWGIVGPGATVSRESSIVKHGIYSAKLTRSGADCQVTSEVFAEYGWNYTRGRQYTFKAWVYATVASRVKLVLGDNAGATQYSSYHTGGSAWEELSVSITVNNAANFLYCGLFIDGGDTSGYIDGCRLVEGSSAPAYEPHVMPFNRFPRQAIVSARNFRQPVGTPGISTQIYANQINNVMYYTTTPANNDEFTFNVWLEDGTYTLDAIGVTANNRGKIDWYVDGVLAISAQDWYAASLTYNVVKTGSITIIGNGYHVIKGKINGKNASSSGYYWALTEVSIYPSTD